VRKVYLLAGLAVAAVLAERVARVTKTRSDTRLDGWTETANVRRTDVPESPLAESA
jgi:hypothetical protein